MKELLTLLIPFVGTSLGAAAVLVMKNSVSAVVERILLGFAAGVMLAASVWSLLIPAMNMAGTYGQPIFLPGLFGFWSGVGLLLWIEGWLARRPVRPSDQNKTALLLLAVVLHNLPEGMAVGVAVAGSLSPDSGMTAVAALALSVGIAIQNIPEGAIISMPLCAAGHNRPKSFLGGVLSGAVEPVAGGLTWAFAGLLGSALPFLLAFAAGAMVYVAVEELIPEAVAQSRHHEGTAATVVGFTVMMLLDVLLG